jgi:DNA-binding protein HU-beta
LEVTKKELKEDGKVALVGFGTIGVTKRPARQGRNPRTGKTIKIAEKKVVRFKPAANILK